MSEREDQALRNEILALPELDPPPGLWDRVKAVPVARQQRTTSRVPLAIAACLVAALAVSVLVIERSTGEADIHDPVLVAQASMADLLVQSHGLEERLRALPFQGVYGPTGRALAYRIADVDGELHALYLQGMDDSAEWAQLLHQRVVLLQSLVEVEWQDQDAALRRVAF